MQQPCAPDTDPGVDHPKSKDVGSAQLGNEKKREEERRRQRADIIESKHAETSLESSSSFGSALAAVSPAQPRADAETTNRERY